MKPEDLLKDHFTEFMAKSRSLDVRGRREDSSLLQLLRSREVLQLDRGEAKTFFEEGARMKPLRSRRIGDVKNCQSDVP